MSRSVRGSSSTTRTLSPRRSVIQSNGRQLNRDLYPQSNRFAPCLFDSAQLVIDRVRQTGRHQVHGVAPAEVTQLRGEIAPLAGSLVNFRGKLVRQRAGG